MAAGKAAMKTETASTAEAAAVGWQRHRWWRKHWDNNDGNDRKQRLRCGPGIALDGGDWYDDGNQDDDNGSCYSNNHDDGLMKGGGSSGVENRAVGGGGGSGSSCGGGDGSGSGGGRGGRSGGSGNGEGRHNQQIAERTAGVAIAVVRRCQARGAKRRRRWGLW